MNIACWFRGYLRDLGHFYRGQTLSHLLVALIIAGYCANFGVDHRIRSYYQTHLHQRGIDWFLNTVEPLGRDHLALTFFILLSLLGLVMNNAPHHLLWRWALGSLRVILIGGPLVLLLQKVLGASRPTEASAHWHFWADNNAVSGHSFIGAIPFLVAMTLLTKPHCRVILLGCSMILAWSRVNSDAHYLSQVLLGWTIAYLAVRALR